jgi:Tol biopolymer transport system component
MRSTVILFSVAILIVSGLAVASEPDSKPYSRHPAISADGETVAFSYGRDIYTVPSSGGAAKLMVADKAFDSHPSFSPDGRYLAFTSSRSRKGDVYTLDLQSGNVKRLTYHSSVDTVEGWGPDCKWVYVSAQRRRVFYNVEVFKAPTPQSVSTMGTGISEFALSPDNKRVAFILRGEVFLGALDGSGGAAANITNAPYREASLGWTGDGKGLVYTSDRSGGSDIFFYDLAAQAERRLTDSPQRDLFPVVSPDGQWCAYYRGISETRLLDLLDGSDSLLAEGFFLEDTAYDYGSLSWSPDSEWVAFVDSEELDFRNVKVVNVHAKEAQQIGFLPNITAFYIHLAPD